KLMWGIKGIYSSAPVRRLQKLRITWVGLVNSGTGSQLGNRDRGRSPFVDCVPAAAIEALGCGVLRTTVRTDGARFKRIESLGALSAFPVRSNGRRSVAGRAGE